MTTTASPCTIVHHFAEIDDPRYQHSPTHLLIDIMTIAICGVICGADDWVAIAEFGRAKQGWFKTFLRLPHGIPSHDTFGDIFAQLDPDQFRESFMMWVEAISDLLYMIYQYLRDFPEASVWLQEPHQDLTHKVIKRVPLWREKDIIWLDVMDPERVIGINPMEDHNG